jgi:hypothetical protein
MTEPQQTEYQRAHAEAAELLGIDIEHLSAADALKIDLCVVLRRAIDTATEDMFAGAPVDLAKLHGAVERLIGLLPAGELPQAHRRDPREALLEMILTMRERSEIGERAAEPTVIAPTEADVTPPGEIGEFYHGPPRPGPDDHLAPPRTPRVIDGKATPALAAPAAPAYDYDANSDWKSYVNSDGSIRSTPRGGGHDWGPI